MHEGVTGVTVGLEVLFAVCFDVYVPILLFILPLISALGCWIEACVQVYSENETLEK